MHICADDIGLDLWCVVLDKLSKQELETLSESHPIEMFVRNFPNVVGLIRCGAKVREANTNHDCKVDNHTANIRHMAHNVIPLDVQFLDSTHFLLFHQLDEHNIH